MNENCLSFLKLGLRKFKLVKILFLTSLFFLFSLKIYSQADSIKKIYSINCETIKKHLTKIISTKKSRNHHNIKTLNSVAGYIKSELAKVCDSVGFQSYEINRKTYKNVIGSIGLKNKERIIIGAHYDVCGNQQGADDNASGVVGLLELARLLSKEKLKYRIDFVAYTLEEPPYFGTKHMGSYVHANYLYTNNIPIKGMICLEMIGYYSDKKDSQRYPIPEMSLLYGNTANFIAVVRNKKSKTFGLSIAKLMEKQKLIKTIDFQGFASENGIDFSDHRNYWEFNYPAIMITNTAFYRNNNYHSKNDTIETLDLKKMCAVIEQLYFTIKQLE